MLLQCNISRVITQALQLLPLYECVVQKPMFVDDVYTYAMGGGLLPIGSVTEVSCEIIRIIIMNVHIQGLFVGERAHKVSRRALRAMEL